MRRLSASKTGVYGASAARVPMRVCSMRRIARKRGPYGVSASVRSQPTSALAIMRNGRSE
jgi:hypothetical protein